VCQATGLEQTAKVTEHAVQRYWVTARAHLKVMAPPSVMPNKCTTFHETTDATVTKCSCENDWLPTPHTNRKDKPNHYQQHNNDRFTALCLDYPAEPVPEETLTHPPS